MIPQLFIQDLLNRTDIVSVIEKYVPLKKAGVNLLGLCPFHTEKTPSFTVSPVKQFYHCFGCGKNGTAIGFLMDYTGLGFVEAVHELASNAGVAVPEDDWRNNSSQRAEKQAAGLAQAEVMAQAGRFYRQQLKTASHAIAYLKERGVSGEVAARFGLGYAPEGWDGLRAVFPDYTAQVLQDAGLVIRREAEEGRSAVHSHYDRFRDRVMFPIRNTRGQIIGFGARVINSGEPKYLNSPETTLFQKGNELYGLFEARQAIREAGYVLVVEGYMDVVALAQLGFSQSVATLGTACTSVQVQKLMRQTDEVVFAFDGDKAGQGAARRALEASLPYVTENKSVRFLFLPPEHDPDSFVREYGAKAFEEQVRQATPFSGFLFQVVAKGNDLSTPEGRAKAQYVAKPLLQAMQPSALRKQIVHRLGELTQTANDELEQMAGLVKPAARRLTALRRQARPQVMSLGRQVLRILFMYPDMVLELEETERHALEVFSSEDALVLADIVHAVHAIGGKVSFAALLEYFRQVGKDYGHWVADMMDGLTLDLQKAKKQLKGALLQIQIQLIMAELDDMMKTGRALQEREHVRSLQEAQQHFQKRLAEVNASS